MSIEHLRRVDRVHGVTGNVVGTTDTQTLTNKTLTNPTITGLNSLCPTGSMLMYGAASAPTGWLLCDGSAVSRTTFAPLFAIVGTTYGVGDGSTTFNLPNFGSKFPRGNTPGTGSGADTHTHAFDDGGHTHTQPTHTHTFNDGGHTHPLGDAGQAQVNSPATNRVSLRRVGTASWNGNQELSGTAQTPSTTENFGAALAGHTDSTTVSGTTSADGADPTGSTHASGTTGSTSNVPAYTAVAFIIKT